MAKIYVVRHGQTDFNKKHICQGGALNAPLNDTGRAQAEAVADQLREVRFEVILSSPLDRAKETAEIIMNGNNFGGTPVYDDRLKERDLKAFDGKDVDDGVMSPLWLLSKDGTINDVETISSLKYRVFGLLDELREKHKDDDILIVCHSGICRLIYYYFNGMPKSGDLYEYKSANCRVEEYNF